MSKSKEALTREYEILHNERNLVRTAIENMHDRIKLVTKDTISNFTSRYENLSNLKSKFNEIQSKVIEFNSRIKLEDLKLEVPKTQMFVDELIYDIQDNYRNLKEARDRDELNANTDNKPPININVPLPKIDIPVFGGQIDEWPNFKALFDSLVHNSNLISPVEKFQYLKSYLRLDAASVVENYQLTTDLYYVAYTALEKRYNNKRRLAQLYIDRILDFSKNSGSNTRNLQLFLTAHTAAVNAFRALNIPDTTDYLLLYICLRNLDNGTRKAFERHCSSQVIPTFETFIQFIEESCKTNELMSTAQVFPPPRKIKPSLFTHKTSVISSNVNNCSKRVEVVCAACHESHQLYACPKFRAMDYNSKRQLIQSSHKCFRCFGSHFAKDCKSKGLCKVCSNGNHHTLLHRTNSINKSPSSPQSHRSSYVLEIPTKTVEIPSLSCHTSNLHEGQTVLLGTAKVLIVDVCGYYHVARAVLDSGSQVSAISLALTKKLGLKIHRSPCQVVGISAEATNVQGTTSCHLRSRYNHNFTLPVSPVILNTIVKELPTTPLKHLNSYCQNLRLADEDFAIPSQIDLLLGADVYPYILNSPTKNLILGKPSALETVFGYVILGPVESHSKPLLRTSLFTITSPLESLVKRFWEIEEVSTASIINEEDEYVEEHFKQHHRRDETGRYVVAIPFKPNLVLDSLHNRGIVTQTFLNQERRLMSNKLHFEAYSKFLIEYRDLGHMVPTSTPGNYLLPHHPVFKQSSSTTKVRVVFNGSAPSNLKHSLNDFMFSGPKLQKPLAGLLINFRQHLVALSTDIRMMYRQIRVRPEDCQYQHILWRPSNTDQITEFELTTITYGLKSSPFLAQRVIAQLSLDDGVKYPLAANVLKSSIDIDDVITGASSLSQAVELRDQLIQLLKCGGFELRKWASSHSAILTDIPLESRETPLIFNTDDSCYKILGMLWDSKGDCFKFHITPFEGKVTKRTVLSYIAKIYDPLGFLSPVIFYLKWFFQQLWVLKLRWDDPLPDDLYHSWISFTSEMDCLSTITIPRYFGLNEEFSFIAGFSDASQRGYSAVLYYVITRNGHTNTSLLASKTKLAPLKTQSIPRLE